MTIPLITLAVTFTVYLVFIELRFGNKLDSISKSFYLLQKTKEGGYFRVFCLMLTASLIVIGGETDLGWFFGSAFGAAFVGTATTYYDRVTKPVHFGGAVMLILFAGIGLAFLGAWWVLVALAGGLAITILLVIAKKLERPVYFYELYAFIILMIGFLTI